MNRADRTVPAVRTCAPGARRHDATRHQGVGVPTSVYPLVGDTRRSVRDLDSQASYELRVTFLTFRNRPPKSWTANKFINTESESWTHSTFLLLDEAHM